MIVSKLQTYLFAFIMQTIFYYTDCQISILTPTNLKQGFLEKYNNDGGSKFKTK